jgi:hypothetical protein
MPIEMPGLPAAKCPCCKQKVDGFFPNPTPMPGDLASLSFMCTLCGAVVSIQLVPRSWLPEEMRAALAQMDSMMAAQDGQTAPEDTLIREPGADDVVQMNPRLRDTLEKSRKRRMQ